MFELTDATNVTASQVNEVYRGQVYGQHQIFSADTYEAHIRSNDIDLRRSVCFLEKAGGGISALALIGFRERRAWIGAFGVLPRLRRSGLGGSCLDEALRRIARARCDSVELEVLETNSAAKALYASRGFQNNGRLFVWRQPVHEDGARSSGHPTFSGQPMGALKRAACWQRERSSIERQAPLSGIERFGSSWAALRVEGAAMRIVDIVATDSEVAQLIDRLEKYRPLILANESADSNVSAELLRRRWPAPRMQYRMTRSIVPVAVGVTSVRAPSSTDLQ